MLKKERGKNIQAVKEKQFELKQCWFMSSGLDFSGCWFEGKRSLFKLFLATGKPPYIFLRYFGRHECLALTVNPHKLVFISVTAAQLFYPQYTVA